jgi:hypothetical protein
MFEDLFGDIFEEKEDTTSNQFDPLDEDDIWDVSLVWNTGQLPPNVWVV